MHKVFISFYHTLDSRFKDSLVGDYAKSREIFVDKSVDTGDINEDLSSETIRTTIRDEYLRDSSVTIVLVGKCSKSRKHIDWEIGSSMIDSLYNKRSGIVVIYLPEIENKWDKESFLPERLSKNKDKIFTINWSQINASSLSRIIEEAYSNRRSQNYDTSLSFRRQNGSCN